MTFKDNINRLCKLHGTNLTTLIKECGFSSSKATAINKGQIPTEEQLIALAKALNCSVMDFFADMELIEKDFADTSYLAGLQENLKEIEQGIITETTKFRLLFAVSRLLILPAEI